MNGRAAATAFVFLLATASLHATSTAGQSLPDSLTWERVGTINEVRGLFFDGDTLYAAVSTSPFEVLRPGDDDWTQAFPSNWTGRDLFITPERVLFFTLAASNLYRSDDGGATAVRVYDDALSLPVLVSDGALVLGARGHGDVANGRVAARSTDLGQTWTEHGGVGGSGLGATRLLVLPPSAALPLGRLVAAGYGGIAVSDDAGQTWTPSSLFGGLVYVAWSMVRVEGGPKDGRLVAVVQQSGTAGALFESGDAGRTWAEVGPAPFVAFRTRLVAGPGGLLYAYEEGEEDSDVYRSFDAGRTWENVGPVWTAWPVESMEIVVGPDGRLYAACEGRNTGSGIPIGGVFRTTEPAFPVGVGDGTPPGEEASSLHVWPNPARGVLHIEGKVGSEAVLYDVLGRELGRASLRTHQTQIDLSGLPPGVYVVQASSKVALITVQQ